MSRKTGQNQGKYREFQFLKLVGILNQEKGLELAASTSSFPHFAPKAPFPHFSPKFLLGGPPPLPPQ